MHVTSLCSPGSGLTEVREPLLLEPTALAGTGPSPIRRVATANPNFPKESPCSAETLTPGTLRERPTFTHHRSKTKETNYNVETTARSEERLSKQPRWLRPALAVAAPRSHAIRRAAIFSTAANAAILYCRKCSHCPGFSTTGPANAQNITDSLLGMRNSLCGFRDHPATRTTSDS